MQEKRLVFHAERGNGIIFLVLGVIVVSCGLFLLFLATFVQTEGGGEWMGFIIAPLMIGFGLYRFIYIGWLINQQAIVLTKDGLEMKGFEAVAVSFAQVDKVYFLEAQHFDRIINEIEPERNHGLLKRIENYIPEMVGAEEFLRIAPLILFLFKDRTAALVDVKTFTGEDRRLILDFLRTTDLKIVEIDTPKPLTTKRMLGALSHDEQDAEQN